MTVPEAPRVVLLHPEHLDRVLVAYEHAGQRRLLGSPEIDHDATPLAPVERVLLDQLHGDVVEHLRASGTSTCGGWRGSWASWDGTPG